MHSRPPGADPDLADMARAGDRDAIAELYRRHFKTTVRSAGRYATHTHSAEDLASEAFTRMLLALRQGSGPTTNIPGYLATAARNVAFQHHRRRVHPAAPAVLEPAELERYAAVHLSALDEVLAHEASQTIDQVLAGLQPRWRHVLTLSALDGLRGEQVAQQLDISVAAVRALRYRARKAFTEGLAAATADQDPPSRPHTTNPVHVTRRATRRAAGTNSLGPG